VAPLFSITIPVYNTEKYLHKAIDSVLTQKFSDFELIIIDDGSTDGCASIIDAYAEKDSRIRAFHRPNGGAYSAMQMGIDLSVGKYVMFIMSDDYMDGKALETVAAQVEEYEYDMVLVNVAVHICDEEQRITMENRFYCTMNESFQLKNKNEVEKMWPSFINWGLTQNMVNAYKTSIIQKFPLVQKYYAADYLLNIHIADAVNSVSYHPAILSHHFQYAVEDTERNISVGKYYDYQQTMLNELYIGYKALFEKWGVLDKNVWLMLAQKRLSDFEYKQLPDIFAWNNPNTALQNVTEVLSYFDDVAAETSALTGRWENIEKAMLNVCSIEMQKIKGLSSKINNIDNKLIQMLYEAKSSKGSVNKKTKVMLDALFDFNNPYRVGLSLYKEFCSNIPKLRNSDTLKYLLAEEKARTLVLAREYDLSEAELSQLFTIPVSTPEKYHLLALNYYNKGNVDEAIDTMNKGLEEFPGSKSLNNLSAMIQSSNIQSEES